MIDPAIIAPVSQQKKNKTDQTYGLDYDDQIKADTGKKGEQDFGP